eukprot:45004_1
MPTKEDYALYKVIIVQIYYVISLPLYVYSISKWIQFHRHFVIYKRFPLISLMMVVLSILNSSLFLFVVWIEHITLGKRILITLPQGGSFFIYGLINLRLFLTYLRWKINHNVNHNAVFEDNYKATSVMPKNLYYHWFSIIILILSCFGGFEIAFLVITPISMCCWTLMMSTTIFLIIIILIQKVGDGIGSMKEGLIMLFVFIITAVCGMAPSDNDFGIKRQLAFLFLGISTYIQGLFPLYIALYYIFKCEKTLNKIKWKENNITQLTSDIDLDTSNIAIRADSSVIDISVPF